MIYELRKYPTLVIHVAKFTERAESIERQMKQAGMYFKYILKGDMEEINGSVVNSSAYSLNNAKPFLSINYFLYISRVHDAVGIR